MTVKTGSKVDLQIENKEGYGCIQAFTVPSFNYQQVIPIGQTAKFSFTAPDSPGEIPFMCSMGMYRGVIRVI